jgi:hypothetical protein
MRYVEYKALIQTALKRNRNGLTWAQLKEKLDLPYQRACPQWTKRMESEIGLTRSKGETGRAYVWKLK